VIEASYKDASRGSVLFTEAELKAIKRLAQMRRAGYKVRLKRKAAPPDDKSPAPTPVAS